MQQRPANGTSAKWCVCSLSSCSALADCCARVEWVMAPIADQPMSLQHLEINHSTGCVHYAMAWEMQIVSGARRLYIQIGTVREMHNALCGVRGIICSWRAISIASLLYCKPNLLAQQGESDIHPVTGIFIRRKLMYTRLLFRIALEFSIDFSPQSLSKW